MNLWIRFVIRELVTYFFKFEFNFIPFAFDIFGFLTLNVVSVLQRVQKIMNNNIKFSRAMNIIFKRIDSAIQKGLTAQLVVCLSFIHM
jgi:hypothetical protein